MEPPRPPRSAAVIHCAGSPADALTDRDTGRSTLGRTTMPRPSPDLALLLAAASLPPGPRAAE